MDHLAPAFRILAPNKRVHRTNVVSGHDCSDCRDLLGGNESVKKRTPLEKRLLILVPQKAQSNHS